MQAISYRKVVKAEIGNGEAGNQEGFFKNLRDFTEGFEEEGFVTENSLDLKSVTKDYLWKNFCFRTRKRKRGAEINVRFHKRPGSWINLGSHSRPFSKNQGYLLRLILPE